jgi:type II secretory pathway predicted ATPase ExeA
MKPRLAINYAGAKYMPIKLKSALMRYGIKQHEWCEAVKQMNGFGLSSSAGNQIINWDMWPRNTPRESIVTQTEALLRERGVPEVEIEHVWEVDQADPMRNAHPAGVHVGQYQKTKEQPEIDPIGEPEMLSPAAKKHFGLFRFPFTDDVNSPEDVYMSPDIRYIREAMYSTAKHGGLLAVVGESGGGKSVLRRDLFDRIARENEQITVIFPRGIDKTKLTAGSICEAIIRDLQPDGKLPQSLESKARIVERALKASAQVGNKHVILIEEAHDITIQCMKYLKRFWEIEDGFKKLLSIILVGQPELMHKLNEANYPEAREFIRRCEVAQLVPLDRNLEDYLKFKFERVGKNYQEVFDGSAFDAIRERLIKKTSVRTISMMNPLMVNNLVTKAMNLAAEIGEEKISDEVIQQL